MAKKKEVPLFERTLICKPVMSPMDQVRRFMDVGGEFPVVSPKKKQKKG